MRSFDGVILRTERIVLRPFRSSDLDALFAIFSDPAVMRYWSGPPWPTVARGLDLIVKDEIAHRSGEHLRLGLEMREGGAVIGMCTLFAFHEQCARAEIGYALASAHWGKGWMQEAMTGLIRFAFGPLALRRLEADIDPRNEASGRLLERLRFKKEGHLRERWVVEGEVSDSALYGLLREDWDSTSAAS